MNNENIKQLLSNQLKNVCDQFMQEKVDSVQLNLMPPKDKTPEINNVDYLQSIDAFEIRLKENINDYNNINGLDISKDNNGHLEAVRINKFSYIDDDIRKKLISAIKNEIDNLSDYINTKPDIVNYIVDKRILLFLEFLIGNYYSELKKRVLSA